MKVVGMDNGELSSLDFRFVVNEMRPRLIGGIFRKIYQFGKKQLAFEVYSRAHGEQILYADNKRMFIAGERMEAIDGPPNFCMFLRKHLMGREINDVRQHGFDRVVEIETDENMLIIEFVPPGNVVLCDKFYNIIMPLEVQRWKHREVRPKESYLFPPSQTDLTKIEIWDFFKEISDSEKDASSALAGMGLGRTYAQEVCVRAGIKPDKPASKVTVDEAAEIFNIFKGILGSEPEPCIYKGMVSAFPLKSVKAACKHASGLSEALDVFFSKEIEEQKLSAAQAAEEKAVKEETERVEYIEKTREEAKEKMMERKAEKFTKAQLIYRNYMLVSNVLDGIKTARDGGMSWQQIKEKLAASSSPEAKAIKEIRENEGIVIVDIEGNNVELDIRKTTEENAGQLFEGAKKLKKKIERIEQLPPPKPMDNAADSEAVRHAMVRDHGQIVEEVQATLAGGKAKMAKPKRVRKPNEAAPFEAVQALAAPAEPKSTRRRLQEAVSGKELIALPTSTSSKAETPALAGEPSGAAESADSGMSWQSHRQPVAKRKAKKRWYESYRWFISSEGNVVIAGKNALQNESAIKSRLKEGDAAFHADIHGAAFVVAKADASGSVGPLAVKEAAEFAAAHSKAWSAGFSEVDVLQFKYGQLSKTSPDGAKMPRGSFYAHRPHATHEKIEVRMSVGVRVDEEGAKVFAGPLMPVRKLCKYFATIQPGSTEGNELAQKVKNAILAKCMPEHRRAIDALLLGEFSRHIPSGQGSLVGG